MLFRIIEFGRMNSAKSYPYMLLERRSRKSFNIFDLVDTLEVHFYLFLGCTFKPGEIPHKEYASGSR